MEVNLLPRLCFGICLYQINETTALGFRSKATLEPKLNRHQYHIKCHQDRDISHFCLPLNTQHLDILHLQMQNNSALLNTWFLNFYSVIYSESFFILWHILDRKEWNVSSPTGTETLHSYLTQWKQWKQ